MGGKDQNRRQVQYSLLRSGEGVQKWPLSEFSFNGAAKLVAEEHRCPQWRSVLGSIVIGSWQHYVQFRGSAAVVMCRSSCTLWRRVLCNSIDHSALPAPQSIVYFAKRPAYLHNGHEFSNSSPNLSPLPGGGGSQRVTLCGSLTEHRQVPSRPHPLRRSPDHVIPRYIRGGPMLGPSDRTRDSYRCRA